MNVTEQITSNGKPASSEFLCAQLGDIVRDRLGPHPFLQPLDLDALALLLPDYLAMSQAFPFLQAGAHLGGMLEIIEHNGTLPEPLELTFSVASFIAWDEAGGHNVVLEEGNPGLPRILETQRNFHANLLQNDVTQILGRRVRPNYGPATRRYLKALFAGLAANDSVIRAAHMVAFEMHAGTMIEALWKTVSAAWGSDPEQLLYFRAHVGGSDPAEAYHEKMTASLVDRVVPQERQADFTEAFLEAYRLNFDWCAGLVDTATAPLDATLTAEPSEPPVWHRGGCHCGAIAFRMQAPAALRAVRCNCSICEMSGYLHVTVSADALEILGDERLLGSYRFNSRIAEHTFCTQCGIKPFYRPRSCPEGFSVNLRCLDRATIASVEIDEFDGQHWEEAIAEDTPAAIAVQAA